MKIKLLNSMYIIFTFLFILLANSSVIASENPPTELNGKIKFLSLNKENETLISFKMTVEMEFVNKSNCTILVSSREPWLNSEFIASSIKNLSKKEYMYSATLYPSNSISAKWEKYRKELDSSTPSQKYFRFILPGETWRFEIETVIEITKTVDIGNGFIIDGWNKVNWSEIKSSPELWLQLEINLWFSNIEPVDSREDKTFGKKLRKQWRKYGYLWLDDIVSEPISLDLSKFKQD